MPDLRTVGTELGTALGMLGAVRLDDLGDQPPGELLGVDQRRWSQLVAAAHGTHRAVVSTAVANGQAFLGADDGLRGRAPLRIEWKGPHRPPGYDLLPADLRVDHVYLVSCKYSSKVLVNAAPAHLFDRGLQDRPGSASADWYQMVAPDELEALYRSVRAVVDPGLPASTAELTRAARDRIAAACARRWPDPLKAPARQFAETVATRTAARWSTALGSLHQRELILWRLLRLSDSPYFVLGTGPSGSLRLRIATPWDWRQHFELLGFDVDAEPSEQPRVAWRARVGERRSGVERVVRGHVEIRWSHGRFCGMPEAKVYLDTPHDRVPGYVPLEAPSQGSLSPLETQS
ncbi:MAG: hypothetical protein ACP5P9_00590 [Acidimicrobiales bacterium]